MDEIVINLHMHSVYSDGHATHTAIAAQAAKAGIDAILVTDHNIWVDGLEGYYRTGEKRVLVLVGEEIHDPLRVPQKNHLLVFGANQEMASLAENPQNLINRIAQAGGISFIAHPFDDALPAFHEDDLSWVDWQLEGYTGIELWNGMSEIKSVIKNTFSAVFYAYFPSYMPHGPLTRTLKLWDGLLASGKKVATVGGSDAHALPLHLGPLHRTLYPYEFHFRCVNTHLLTPAPLSGDLPADRQMVVEALRLGHAFVGYDLPASTRGFRFTAHGQDGAASMGDDLLLHRGTTLEIRLPQKVECRLICNGQVVKTWRDREACAYITTQPGSYRVEAYIPFRGSLRGWIFSNPIYLRDKTTYAGR